MVSRSVLTCFVAILILSLSGCSRLYDFEGIVVDGDGQPISGATIMLYPHDCERPTQFRNDGISGEDGSFVATWGVAVGVDYF